MVNRLLSVFVVTMVAMLSLGQRTINVSSPVKNDFLGKTNTVNFAITGAKFQVTVKIKATRIGSNDVVTNEKKFTPDANDKVNDSVALNFSDGTPQGQWKVEITPVEFNNNNVKQVYTPSTVVINPVVVDVKSPTFYSVNPLDGNYVRGAGANGIVHIRANLNEPNIDLWKIQINSGDIPNNSGSTKDVDVLWSTKGIQKDGSQTISIKVDDKAKNTVTKTIDVTLDRVSPSTQIVTPGPSTFIPPNTTIPVVVTISDQFGDSVDVTGIDVVAKTLDNKFIARVSRRSTTPNGNTISYVGRLRWSNSLPKTFKLVVTAYDKAGNKAEIQETKVNIANR